MASLAELIRQTAYLKSGGKSAEYKDINDVAGEIPGDYITKAVSNFIAIKKGAADATKAAGENAPTVDPRQRFEQLKSERQKKIDTATATGMPSLTNEQAEVATQYLNPPAPTNNDITLENGTPTLAQSKGLATTNATRALGAQRLTSKQAKELTPVTATEEDEISTGGLIKAGTSTTLGRIEEIAKLNRTKIIATGQGTRQEDRQQFSEEQQARSFQQKEEAENRASRKRELDNITDVEANLKSYMGVLNQVPAGLAGGAQTVVSKTGLAFPEAATADRTRNAIAVALYRALTGDTRLSDADAAARATPLIAAAYQSPEQRTQLESFINNRLQERKQRILQGIGGEMPLPVMGDSPKDQFQVGQTIQKNGKNYVYRGNNQWEEQ